MDQQVYAIKKTVLKVPSNDDPCSHEELSRMIQEARLFASISSPHIIRYNHSWIEVEDCLIEYDEIEEDNETDELSVELESPFIDFYTNPDNEEVQKETTSSKYREKTMIKISLYIQMELCKETLEDYVNRRKVNLVKEEYEKSLDIARQLIEAIYIVHNDCNIIHRDLSLRNVFIAMDEKIKIGDFGLATRCNYIKPVLSSPFLAQRKEPSSDEIPDFLCLEDNDESLSSCERELTHGLGTKTFAAPEQMNNSQYDQKADIYSLGLILLVLFYPTVTASERYEILKTSRKQGPPKEFMDMNPEIGEIIKRMMANDPSKRPNAEDLKNLAIFKEKKCDNTLNKKLNEKKCIVQIGSSGKTKIKYVKIIRENILLYDDKIRNKAKMCYPLKECKIIETSNNSVYKKKIRKNCSFHNLNDSMAVKKYLYEITLEHPQLESLHIFV